MAGSSVGARRPSAHPQHNAVIRAIPGSNSALKLHRGTSSGEVSIEYPHDEHSEKSPKPSTGTHPAIRYLTTGVAPLFERCTGRGGARNRADRESHKLKASHVANLIAAEREARTTGLPFTRMVTIHWESADVPLAAMTKATGKFLDLLTKALARRGCRTAWLWVHENGHAKGGHTHILVHVPPCFVPVLSRSQRRWLKAITGKTYKRRVIHSNPIGGRLGLEGTNPELHLANVAAALAYVLKGADHEAADQFRLTRLAPGGRIIGKRCGTSQNIGPKARKRSDGYSANRPS